MITPENPEPRDPEDQGPLARGEWKPLQQYLQEGVRAAESESETLTTPVWVRALKLDFCASFIWEEFFELELLENEDVLREWEERRAVARSSRRRPGSADGLSVEPRLDAPVDLPFDLNLPDAVDTDHKAPAVPEEVKGGDQVSDKKQDPGQVRRSWM